MFTFSAARTSPSHVKSRGISVLQKAGCIVDILFLS
jgi:hypothetical protein